jgi:hypothetical protein
VSSFSTVITNEFIGEDFYLSQHSMDGHEAMGFDVTQVTQDVEQSLFTIKTNMPIPTGTLSSGQNMVITFYH